MGTQKVGNLLDTLDHFMETVRLTKQAEAGGQSDPGTQHPVGSADDQTQSANENGPRSAENKQDVIAAIGQPAVDATGAQTAGGSTKPSDSIGTVTLASDQPKGGNIDTPKATKDAPPGGASSPGQSTFSEKYSEVANIGNTLLAELAVSLRASGHAVPEKTAAEVCATKTIEETGGTDTEATKPVTSAETKVPEQKKAEDEAEKKAQLQGDLQAGYLSAQALATLALQGGDVEKTAAAATTMGSNPELIKAAMDGFETAGTIAGVDKTATDEQTQVVTEVLIKTANDDVGILLDFLKGYAEGHVAPTKPIQKTAQGIEDLLGAVPPAVEELPLAGGSGVPPELMAALEGGGEEAPIEDTGTDGEEVLGEIANALEEAGVTPEDLAAAVEEAGAGGALPEMAPPVGSAEAPLALAELAGAAPQVEKAPTAGTENEEVEENEAAEKAAKLRHVIKRAGEIRKAKNNKNSIKSVLANILA